MGNEDPIMKQQATFMNSVEESVFPKSERTQNMYKRHLMFVIYQNNVINIPEMSFLNDM